MTASETDAYIAIGANLGDREARCREAVARLAAVDGIRVTAVSSWIETDPVGPVPQGRFINGAVAVATTLPPRQLLDACLAVEADMGRKRAERWGPRPIDLDILLYGGSVIEMSGLTVPHPEMTRRRFVLEPLAEIAPQAAHPVEGVTVAELLDRLDMEQPGGRELSAGAG